MTTGSSLNLRIRTVGYGKLGGKNSIDGMYL